MGKSVYIAIFKGSRTKLNLKRYFSNDNLISRPTTLCFPTIYPGSWFLGYDYLNLIKKITNLSNFQGSDSVTKWAMLKNSLSYLCERVLRDVISRSGNGVRFEIAHCLPPANAELADKLTTGLSKVPDRLEWLVRNQNYALIQCSFSYHKRCYRMIAIRRRKRQAQLKARFLIPSAWV